MYDIIVSILQVTVLRDVCATVYPAEKMKELRPLYGNVTTWFCF